ncbi:hypothetical protein AAMO2058_001459300 [Amorphochlora amoebiformis]
MDVAEIPWNSRRRGCDLGSMRLLVFTFVALASFAALNPLQEASRHLSAVPARDRLAKRSPSTTRTPLRSSRAEEGTVMTPKRLKISKKEPISSDFQDDDEDDDDIDDDIDDDEDEDDDDDDFYQDMSEFDDTPVRFKDVDGDRILFKLGKKGQLSEYVNGVLEVKTVKQLSYDSKSGTVYDECGNFVVPKAYRKLILQDIVRLTNLAYPPVKLYGFDRYVKEEAIEDDIPVLNHDQIQAAIKNEQERIKNATKAVEGMQKLVGKWKKQLGDEEKDRQGDALPTWQKIHLMASIKRRKKDIDNLESDIKAMEKARSYMEETVTLYKLDLNETLAGPKVPEISECRTVVVAPPKDGNWPMNPLHTGHAERSETPNSFTVTIAAPGMTEEDVRVSIKDNTLLIKAAIQQILDGGSCIQTIDREFSLPINADAAKVKASFSGGNLVVEIPKLNALPPNEAQDKCKVGHSNKCKVET